MSKKAYNKIKYILDKLLEIPSNREIIGEDYGIPENILLTISFSYLQGNMPLKDLNSDWNPVFSVSCMKESVPGILIPDFPFSEEIILSQKILKTLISLLEKEKLDFPAIVHEFFLENFPDDRHSSHKRKKRGIYYTPHYIAQYIIDKVLRERVNNTLSRMKECVKSCNLAGFVKHCESIGEMKILDPSCGWGIFLLKAYDVLDEFYRRAGKLAGNILEKKACLPFDDVDMLSAEYLRIVNEAESVRKIKNLGVNPGKIILKNNLFGIDIDNKVVKICRHLLYIKAGLQPNEKKRVTNNVKNANFITDFFETYRQKFDLIVGNPPYFTVGGGGKGKKKTQYHKMLKEHPLLGKYFRSQSDIFYYFIIGGIDLLKPGGIISFITPSYWLENEYADLLREKIVEDCEPLELINFTPLKVFETRKGNLVNVDTSIFFFRKKEDEVLFDFKKKEKASKDFFAYIPDVESKNVDAVTSYSFIKELELNKKELPECSRYSRITISMGDLSSGKWIITPFNGIVSLMKKDGKDILPLGDISEKNRSKYPSEFKFNGNLEMQGICRIGQGQETGLSEVFTVDEKQVEEFDLEKEVLKPVLKNSHILRYGINHSDKYMILLNNLADTSLYPNTLSYLKKNREGLESRQRVLKGARKWFEISIPQNYGIFDEPEKIVVPYRAKRNRFAIDRKRHFNDGGDVRGLVIKEEYRDILSCEYLVGLLNSTLITFWYFQCGKKKGGIYEYFTNPLSRIPIKIPDCFTKNIIDNLVVELQNLYNTLRNGLDKKGIKTIDNIRKKIWEREFEIDRIVYEIYGINKSDIDNINKKIPRRIN